LEHLQYVLHHFRKVKGLGRDLGGLLHLSQSGQVAGDLRVLGVPAQEAS
jgi:hypothetical protein